ncbi:MAG: sulfatase-like hydrolase/transferase [Candidatus Lokiarchaeota archaeon]|nr:sulfatase-like hydrolase/transferase [Candidatus Lokiarchaeota archaeon]
MAKKNMNVLFIMTDQHRADHMGCAGNPVVKTPNLDRLAQEGVRFTNAYCANPMCMPNRASIFTGVYPNVHGVRSNGINLPNTVETFVEAMRKNGYITHNVGKMHLQFFIPPYKRKDESAEMIAKWMHPDTAQEALDTFPQPYYGFEDCEICLGHGDICGGHYLNWLEEKRPGATEWMRNRLTLDYFHHVYFKSEMPVEQYPTTYCQERTINFLERHSKGEYGDKPFFLCCSIPDPHHPVCPPGEYHDMYKTDDIELPPTFVDKNIEDHKFLGPLVKNPVFRGAMLRQSDEQEVKEFTRLTYGAVTLFDQAIGQILSSLEKSGYAENTIVIYTSDHGDLMGDHGMIYKGPSPFEGVLKVPLIMKVPGVTTSGSVSNSLVSSIDFAKTILNLTKVRKRLHSPFIQGVDITPVLNDPEIKVRDCCYIEEDEEVGPLKIRVRHLITETHKLTVYEGLEGVGDIYDRINDPDELNNLWDKDRDLRENLVLKILEENLKAQTKLPARQAAS